MSDRWTTYGGPPPAPAPGWRFETVTGPSRLWGANGIVWGAGGQLMVTQVFGSQVTAIDVDSGAHRSFAALGEGINAPDDGAFGHDGTFFATEPMNATVSARLPDGGYRTLRDDLPGANGMAVSHDRRRLFVDEFRPGGRLLELDPSGEKAPVVLADDLAMPNAFAMGPDGALWFPQVIAGEVWRYDLDDGSLERRIRDLATPTAVKFDAAGHLLTSEAGSGELTQIDVASGARETLARVNPGIDNFAVGDGGRLFVSHFTDGRVAEVTGGVERVLSPSGLIGAFGLGAVADGSLLDADRLAVAAIERDGATRCLMNLITDLPSLALDVAVLDGEVLVLVERGQVFRRPASGERARQVAGHLERPSALCESGDGGAYVAERKSGRVLRIDGAGAVTGEVATGLRRPRALAVGAEGTLWVAQDGGVVGLRDGAPVREFDAVAQPHGVAEAGSTLFIADPTARRVVAVDLSSGDTADVVRDAPLGPPVESARVPVSTTPLLADGDGVLVGCDGDGSVRRLAAT